MKEKIHRFLKLLVYLILNATLTGVFILLTYGLSLLLKHTVGEKWPEVSDTITHGAVVIASVIGALQFIGITMFRAYKILREEIRNEANGNEANGND